MVKNILQNWINFFFFAPTNDEKNLILENPTFYPLPLFLLSAAASIVIFHPAIFRWMILVFDIYYSTRKINSLAFFLFSFHFRLKKQHKIIKSFISLATVYSNKSFSLENWRRFLSLIPGPDCDWSCYWKLLKNSSRTFA